MGICRFSYNFPKIYSKTRVIELHERASQASFTSERAKRSLHKSSKPSIVRTTEASFAGKQANRSLRKPAKANQTKQIMQQM